MGLAVVARAKFPGAFGPAGNWLSDLGNRALNPSGAAYYRLAGVLGGLLLLVFFSTLHVHAGTRTRRGRVLLTLVGVFGGLASVCFVMTGVFSEDMMPVHSWFSIANYVLFGTAIALTGIAALLGEGLPRWLAFLCIAAWGFDIASGIFGRSRWLEWVVVAFLIAYVAALAVIPSSGPNKR